MQHSLCLEDTPTDTQGRSPPHVLRSSTVSTCGGEQGVRSGRLLLLSPGPAVGLWAAAHHLKTGSKCKTKHWAPGHVGASPNPTSSICLERHHQLPATPLVQGSEGPVTAPQSCVIRVQEALGQAGPGVFCRKWVLSVRAGAPGGHGRVEGNSWAQAGAWGQVAINPDKKQDFWSMARNLQMQGPLHALCCAVLCKGLKHLRIWVSTRDWTGESWNQFLPGDYPGLSEWASCNHRVLKSERGNQKKECDSSMRETHPHIAGSRDKGMGPQDRESGPP